MDVLWFRLPRKDTDETETFGHIEAGMMLVMINRSDYWQCAFLIPKGGIERVKAAGLDVFRSRVVMLTPYFADRIAELKSWDDVKLLGVTVDRLRQWWRPGLICIGDAAHAMSPVGGVGINLAVQDAVAAANRLVAPLKAGTVSDDDLRAIEARRTFPVRFTQRLQLIITSAAPSRRLSGRSRRSCSNCSTGSRCCAASPAGCWPLASGPSTSIRRRRLPRPGARFGRRHPWRRSRPRPDGLR